MPRRLNNFSVCRCKTSAKKLPRTQNTNTCMVLVSNLKTYLSLIYSWSIQTSRSGFLILIIKCQFPYGDTSALFQIIGRIYKRNFYFLMVTITFISSIQNRKKEYCISMQPSRTFCVCKTKHFFSVTTRAFDYFLHSKNFSIFSCEHQTNCDYHILST